MADARPAGRRHARRPEACCTTAKAATWQRRSAAQSRAAPAAGARPGARRDRARCSTKPPSRFTRGRAQPAPLPRCAGGRSGAARSGVRAAPRRARRSWRASTACGRPSCRLRADARQTSWRGWNAPSSRRSPTLERRLPAARDAYATRPRHGSRRRAQGGRERARRKASPSCMQRARHARRAFRDARRARTSPRSRRRTACDDDRIPGHRQPRPAAAPAGQGGLGRRTVAHQPGACRSRPLRTRHRPAWCSTRSTPASAARVAEIVGRQLRALGDRAARCCASRTCRRWPRRPTTSCGCAS